MIWRPTPNRVRSTHYATHRKRYDRLAGDLVGAKAERNPSPTTHAHTSAHAPQPSAPSFPPPYSSFAPRQRHATMNAEEKPSLAFPTKSNHTPMDFFSHQYDGSDEKQHPVIANYASRRHSYAIGEVLASQGGKRARRNAMDGTTRRARASVEFLLCEVLDDIVNLGVEGESSGEEEEEEEQISPISQISEAPRELTPSKRANNPRWRTRFVLWGATVGVICSAVLR